MEATDIDISKIPIEDLIRGYKDLELEAQKRSQKINELLEKYRGERWMPWLNFDSDVVPYVEYWYDVDDNSIHAGNVSVPFNYTEDEINNEVIDKCLDELHLKVWRYYKENGIDLKFYED